MTWKASILQTCSPPYPLSNTGKRGVSDSTPDLLEIFENGVQLDARRMPFLVYLKIYLGRTVERGASMLIVLIEQLLVEFRTTKWASFTVSPIC